MRCIHTKYISRTETKGPRIVARSPATRIIVSWDHGLNPEGNHIAAAKELAAKLEWEGTLAVGMLYDETYVHVLLD